MDQPRTARGAWVELACVAGSMLLCVMALVSSSSSFVVNVNGVVEDAGGAGLAYEDAILVAAFRRPVVDAALLHRGGVREALRARLGAEFESDRGLIETRMPGASEREMLLAYLTLRANGSVPVFDPSSHMEDDLGACLLPRSGNCATLAMRLLVLLDVFGFDATLVHWWSPAMEGHVFVDARDPSGGRAYFLDPTVNLVVGVEATEGGVLGALAARTPEERRGIVEKGLTAFPHCFSMIENAALDFDEWSLVNRLRVVDSAISGLTFGLPIVSKKWESGELPRPRRLREMAETYPNLIRALAPPLADARAGDS